MKDFDKFFISYPTILLMLKRESEALEALNKIETICNYLCTNYFEDDCGAETID